jgi:hypothetical protein
MSLRELFDALTLDDLRAFVANQQGEDLTLDFKTVNRAELDADDRKNLAKALSGFSNSSGGLIVWGIDARKNDQGLDCATEVREIERVSVFLARLNELTSRAVDPPVDGIRHKTIVSADDRGCAVTLVPESDRGPHMAKLREDRYYKRSGDSFYKLEHFDLQDMFGRRKRPSLSLEANLVRPRSEIILSLKNTGRGVAQAPYLSLHIPEPFGFALYGLDGNGNDGLPRLPLGESASSKRRYGGNSIMVIHPNTSHDVTKIEYRGREENRPEGAIEIRYEVTAEGIQLKAGTVNINLDR